MVEHTGNGRALVGREALVKEVAAALSASEYFGVVLVGEPGVGKTAVAQSVTRQLNGKVAVIPVTASPSLRKVPYGALSPYLRTLSINDVGSSVAVYRSLMKHLDTTHDGRSRTPLFLVDDSHDLDDNTSMLLSQLVAGKRARILALARTNPGPTLDIASLWQDGLLQRHDLEPLTSPQVQELCEKELGGSVLTSVSATLERTSGGNPMFLLALLRQARRSGYLGTHNGVWRLVGHAPPLDVSLVDLIKSRFRRRTEREIAVVETLAFAEPMPLEALKQCTDNSALASLHEDGLITISEDRDRMAGLGHPLYGEVIRQSVPAGRSLSIRRKVLNLLDRDSTSANDFLRYVAWGLDCGMPPADETLLQAAVVANRLFDADFALRAARAVNTPDLRGSALVEIARAQMMRGNLPYARQIVDEVLDQCESLPLAKEASMLSVALRVRESNPADAIRRDAARWATIAEDLARKQDSAPSPPAAGRLGITRNGYRILESFALNYEGRFPEAEMLLRVILQDAYCSTEVRLAALSLLGEAEGSLGRAMHGAGHTSEAIEIILSNGHKFVEHLEFVMARHFLCLSYAGCWDQMEGVLDKFVRPKSGDTHQFSGMVELCQGLMALRKGLMRSARTSLILAVEGLRETDLNQVLPMTLGLAAFACAMVGDTTRARSYAADFSASAVGGTRQAHSYGKIHIIAANAVFHGAAQSIGELNDVAADAAERGMNVLAAHALELAARLGDEHCFPQLAALTSTFEGPEGAVVSAMAAAAAARDPAALVNAANVAQQSGYVLIAAECLGKAVRLLAHRGEEHKSRTLQLQLDQLIPRLEGLQSPQFTRVHSTAKLTQREQDIARLAGNGFTNREIAQEQGVSVRTVEGHLYRIFAKLGITRREDLPRGSQLDAP